MEIKQYRDSEYYVGSCGNIFRDGMKLALYTNGRYLQFTYYDNTYPNGITLRVHRVVAEVFLPVVEGKLHVNHKNGIKSDNSVANLEWVTLSENMAHAHALELYPKGSSCYQAVLNEDSVYYIKECILQGASDPTMAKMFGVDKGTIRQIRIGNSWKHVMPGVVLPQNKGPLSLDQVEEIRVLLASGMGVRAIGRLYGRTSASISSIKLGKSFK